MEITFILTEACNLRCTYCYQKNFPANHMPEEVGVAALRSAVAQEPESLALTFFGGEPLLRADTMFAILRSARDIERESRVRMTAKVPTNGLLLDNSIIERAAQYGLFISLSFDGVRPAQEAGRIRLSGGSSFDDVERALRLLVAAGRPFGVYSVITPSNVRYLSESRRYLWDMGARILVSAIDYTANWDERSLEILREQLADVGEFYEERLRSRDYFHLEPFDSRISQHTRRGELQGCCPALRQVTVGPDGTLYGCVEYFYRRMSPLGTAEAWLDPARVDALMKARGKMPDECEGCGVNDRCTNHCDCVNLRTTGHPDLPPRSACLTEQTTLQMVDLRAARLFRKRVPEFLLRQYSSSYHMLSAVERYLETLGVSHE
jgi:uncharacterized protein